MTVDEQLKLWVEGTSVHNDERDECCPDFSCCNEKMKTPLVERKRFVAADESDRMKMLGMFLGQAMATMGDTKKVHIIGDETNYDLEH